MTAEEAWTKTLKGAGIPEHVCKKLQDMQYTTADSFCFKDEATLEAFVKHLLLKEKVENGVDDSCWAFHPLCGKLKGLWRKISATTDKGLTTVAVPAPSSATTAAAHAVQQLIGACGKILTVVDRDKMRRELEQKFTGALVSLSTLPCMSLLNAVHTQKQNSTWEWIGWKRLLSEKQWQAMKSRKSGDTKDRFIEALALGVGLEDDQWDRDLPAAPFQVQTMLQVRNFAYAMVGACHLGSLSMYSQRFIEYYTAEPGDNARYPTVQEAEQADHAALQEVFNLCYNGANLDDALCTVAVNRDMLRQLLCPRPKLPRAVKVDRPPLKRRAPQGAGSDAGNPNGECFDDWRKGKCTRAKCRYLHSCAMCGAADHHADQCKFQGDIKKKKKLRK